MEPTTSDDIKLTKTKTFATVTSSGNILPSTSTQLEPPLPESIKNQIHEDKLLASQLSQQESELSLECSSDAALAMMLQRQLDLEHDQELKLEEARLNGRSKVGVSLDKFRRLATNEESGSNFSRDRYAELDCMFEDGCNSYVKDDHGCAWDVFEQEKLEQKSRMMGRSGFIVDQDGNITTKHDLPMSGRKNMCRLMESKTDIQTGDAGATKDDFKITNYVYNRLNDSSKKIHRREQKRSHDKRVQREKVLELIEDNEKLSNKMNDSLRPINIKKLNGVVGHGKESTILHGLGYDSEQETFLEVAVKVFKSDSNLAFKTRDSYNKSKCPSYKFDKPHSKNDSLRRWAEQGFKNLKSLRKANINCPEAISLRKNILVMSFLGQDAVPSPQLKNAKLDLADLKRSYEQVVDLMNRMYKECDLIHGDLSEYNLLWHDSKVYVIDVSQSMFTNHPNANAFLYRDCKNVIDFFNRSPLTDLMDEKSLFKLICGRDLDEKDIETWTKVADFPCNEKIMIKENNSSKNISTSDNFDAIHSSIMNELSSI